MNNNNNAGQTDINQEVLDYLAKIKKEPVDSENESSEYAEPVPEPENHSLVPIINNLKRRMSSYDDGNIVNTKLTRFSVDDPVPVINLSQSQGQSLPWRQPAVNPQEVNLQASTSSGAGISRDPRLSKKIVNGNSNAHPIGTTPNTNPTNVIEPIRAAFLNRSLTAEDIVKLNKSSVHLPQSIRDVRNRVSDAQKLANTRSAAFYANLPLMTTGSIQQRSPMITNNHNSLLRSQITPENAQRSYISQRHCNVPSSVKDFAQRVGADLDAISHRMQPPRRDEGLTETFFQENQRSSGTQTEPSTTEEKETERPKEVELATKEVQTEKNNGVFSITIHDLTELTMDQRKGLEEFKRLMNRTDENSTSAILSRVNHRRANIAYDRDRNRRNGEYNNGAGSSRDDKISRYSNPAPPSKNSSARKVNFNARPE